MTSNKVIAKGAKAVRGANFSDQLDAAVENFLGATGNQSFLDTKYSRSVEVINVPASSFLDTEQKKKKKKKNGLQGLDKIIGTEVIASGNRIFVTTTAFTGCSFCMQATDTSLVATHRDPEEVVK